VDPDIGIRPVVRADRESWLGLRTQLWPDHTQAELAREVDSHLGGGALWKLGAGSIPFRILVAEHSLRGIVGFIEASLRPFAVGCRTSPVGYLEGWFVMPELRRQGIGEALVRSAEAWARANGCQEMASDARLENAVSEKSHTALGYDVVGRSIHFRRDLL